MAHKGRNETLLKLLLFLGYLVFGAQNMTQILAVSSLPHTTRTAQKLTRPDNQIELPKKKNQDKNNSILNERIFNTPYMSCHGMKQGVDSIPTNIHILKIPLDLKSEIPNK